MKIARWEEYQEFFQLIILRYLVVWFSLVPIIASLTSQLPDPLPIKLSGVTYDISLTLPFQWQLLWMSSLFFVIALSLYKVRCPNFIQKYNDFSDYSACQHHPRWLVSEIHRLLKISDEEQKKKLCERLSSKGYIEKIEDESVETLCKEPVVEKKQTVIKFKLEGASYRFGMPVDESVADENSEKDIFYELFGRYSASRWYSRLFIKICLLASLVFFIVVLVQHILNGGSYVWKWFLGL